MPNDLTTQAPEEPSLRDMIAENLESVSTSDATPAPVETPKEVVATPTETAQERETRERDEQGRFVAGQPKPAAQDKTASTPASPQAAAPVAAGPVTKFPSTWKPEIKAAWEKADPSIHAEVSRREADYAKGVSVYKNEYDRLKPLDEAVAPFRDVMRQYGVNEAQMVNQMLTAHHTLSLGTPEQRLSLVNQVISDYKMPVRLAMQGQDGQWQLVDTNALPRQQAPQPQPKAPDISAIVRDELAAQSVRQTLSDFIASKDGQGNPLYQHYETVKDDMALLLEHGKAPDLQSAYKLALKLHDDLWQQEQQKDADARKASEAAAAKAKAVRARSNAVSVPSANPGGPTQGGDKSLREQLAENLSSVASGRV